MNELIEEKLQKIHANNKKWEQNKDLLLDPKRILFGKDNIDFMLGVRFEGENDFNKYQFPGYFQGGKQNEDQEFFPEKFKDLRKEDIPAPAFRIVFKHQDNKTAAQIIRSDIADELKGCSKKDMTGQKQLSLAMIRLLI